MVIGRSLYCRRSPSTQGTASGEVGWTRPTWSDIMAWRAGDAPGVTTGQSNLFQPPLKAGGDPGSYLILRPRTIKHDIDEQNIMIICTVSS